FACAFKLFVYGRLRLVFHFQQGRDSRKLLPGCSSVASRCLVLLYLPVLASRPLCGCCMRVVGLEEDRGTMRIPCVLPIAGWCWDSTVKVKFALPQSLTLIRFFDDIGQEVRSCRWPLHSSTAYAVSRTNQPSPTRKSAINRISVSDLFPGYFG